MHDLQSTNVTDYARYLTKMVTATVNQMREAKFSRRRRDAFLKQLHVELMRLLKTPGGYAGSFDYCSAIIIDVLLMDPHVVPFPNRSRWENPIKWKYGDNIIKRLRKRSKFTVINPTRDSYPKRVMVGFNLAATVRRMRTAIHAYPCIAADCSHARFGYTYYEVFRNAQRELRWKVHLALDHRLPAELIEMVVQETFVAEGVDRYLEHDTELVNLVPYGWLCERARASHPRHRPDHYYASDYSDEPDEASDRTYNSEGYVTESFYSGEADEDTLEGSDLDDDDYDHNDSTD